MHILKLILPAAALILFLGGCQTVPYQGQAHDVKRKPQEEGIVGIPIAFKDEDRAKAEEKMKSNCNPGPYKIMEEGEVVIGQETKSSGRETNRASSQHQVGKLFGMPLVSGEAAGKNLESSQTTSNVKEWQISYKCVAENSTNTRKR